MKTENTENLIELHEKLNNFAVHHQDIGMKKAYDIIDSEFKRVQSNLRSGHKDDVLADKAYDQAFCDVLELIKKELK